MKRFPVENGQKDLKNLKKVLDKGERRWYSMQVACESGEPSGKLGLQLNKNSANERASKKFEKTWKKFLTKGLKSGNLFELRQAACTL